MDEEKEGLYQKKNLFYISIYFLFLTILGILTFVHSNGFFEDIFSLEGIIFMTILIVLVSGLLIFSIYGIWRVYAFLGIIIGIIWFITIKFTKVSEGLFGLAILTEYVIIFSLVVVPVVFFLGRFYYKFKYSNNKYYTYILIALPFIMLAIWLILSLSTCSFNQDTQCVFNKVVKSGNPLACFDSEYFSAMDSLISSGCLVEILNNIKISQGISQLDNSTCNSYSILWQKMNCLDAVKGINQDTPYCYVNGNKEETCI